MSGQNTERWAFVAGGSGGIGREVCGALARDGWNVALSYRSNLDAAQGAAEDVRAAGKTVVVTQLDLTEPDEVETCLNELFGDQSLHGVVYAGGPHIDMNYASALKPRGVAEQLAGDSVAAFSLLHAAIPHLRKSGGAAVALSSAAVARLAKRDLLSTAPKAAVEAMVKTIALEEGRYNVRANAVAVGLLDDGMMIELREEGAYNDLAYEVAHRNIPLPRLGTSRDVADAVAFLLGDKASWITGQVLAVDGGYSV